MFIPEWKGAIEGYTVNFLRRNYWRVAGVITWEQALAEGQFVFAKVLDRYPYIDSPKWFMAMYKRMLSNRIHTLSHESTFYRGFESLEELQEEQGEALQSGRVDYNEGYLMLLIEQAPSEIRELIELLLDAPTEVRDAIRAAWQQRKGGRRKTNVVLCELVGKDPTTHDLVGDIHRYFS